MNGENPGMFSSKKKLFLLLFVELVVTIQISQDMLICQVAGTVYAL